MTQGLLCSARCHMSGLLWADSYIFALGWIPEWKELKFQASSPICAETPSKNFLTASASDPPSKLVILLFSTVTSMGLLNLTSETPMYLASQGSVLSVTIMPLLSITVTGTWLPWGK